MRNTPRTVGVLSLALLSVSSLTLTAQQSRTRVPAYTSISGTYELESTRGNNAEQAAQIATRSLPPGQRDRAYQTLLARLDPPQLFSIERTGLTVTIASSRGARSTFDADGRMQSERGPGGRTSNTRAEFVGNQLRVSTSGGSRGSDFMVTFEPMDNGTGLRVTRRLDDDDLRGPVTILSYYRRTAAAPRWDVYSSEPDGQQYPTRSGDRSGYRSASLVPDGTRLVATLDTPIGMRTSLSGETFAMTVRGPAEFEGARIAGVISRVNDNRSAGDSQDLRLDFESIQWRGRSADFDAILNTVRLRDGTTLRVNGDGDVRDSSNDRIRNGAIGVAVGAIIGALAGGGKGAAIGAVVGGTGGVIVSQGHEQLDLRPGTEVTVTVVEPYRAR